MNSVEDTAQEIFIQPMKQKLQTIMSISQSMFQLINNFKHQPKADTPVDTPLTSSKANQYSFTGQHTDIAFCGVSENGVNIDDINNIPISDTRENTMLSYNKAVSDGYLSYNEKTGNYILTEKGKMHINSESFIEQFEKDQKQGLVDNNLENTVSIKLQGNGNDLNVFRYVDSIDLNKLTYSDPAKYKQVVSYFDRCKQYNFVEISNDGFVTPTEKTTKMLEQNQNLNLDNIEKITTKNVDTIINLNDYRIKENVNTAVKSTAEATKETGNTAKHITNAVALETAKKTAENTSKAVMTTAKTGATVAKVGTSAVAGASTVGVSVGVQAVVELGKEGVKAFNKASTLNQNNKIKLSTQK